MSAKARTRRIIVSGVEWAVRLSAAYGAVYLFCLAAQKLMLVLGLD